MPFAKLFKFVAVGTDQPDDPFMLGPDRDPDLRSTRPYFLLPLMGRKAADVRRSVIDRIRRHAAGREAPITDVFVLSHGWHRNFFSAVSAYDRLVSRLTGLLTRGAIERPAGFNPLFITVHWSSDPGEDIWLDKDGRRHKSSFMANIGATFQPNPDAPSKSTLTRDFERIFELLSTLSAPDVEARAEEWNAPSRTLADILDKHYILHENKVAELPDKIAALWTCYCTSQAKQVLATQDEKPAGFAGVLQGFAKLFGLVAKAVPAATLLGLLVNLPIPKLQANDVQPTWTADGRLVVVHSVRRATVRDAVAMGWRAVGYYSLVLTGTPPDRAESPDLRVWRHGGSIVSFGVLALVLLVLLAVSQSRVSNSRPARGVPWLALAAWLYLQVLLAAPAVLYLLALFLLSGLQIGRLFEALRLLSTERTGRRGHSPTELPTFNIGRALAVIARLPVTLLRAAVAVDSRVTSVVDAVECQLAFFEMQQRGVATGAQTAEAITAVFKDLPALAHARIHLAGHSFGTVVLCNAARHLAYDGAFTGNLRTVTLLEGAIASSWFSGERDLRKRVSGAIASVFSRYDTANGFWYPFASLGRLAAGHVGLCGDFEPEHYTMPPMLVSPPSLPAASPAEQPRVLNIDASRLIYEGQPVTGGGHGDIYKDDVLHVLWAVTRV